MDTVRDRRDKLIILFFLDLKKTTFCSKLWNSSNHALMTNKSKMVLILIKDVQNFTDFKFKPFAHNKIDRDDHIKHQELDIWKMVPRYLNIFINSSPLLTFLHKMTLAWDHPATAYCDDKGSMSTNLTHLSTAISSSWNSPLVHIHLHTTYTLT